MNRLDHIRPTLEQCKDLDLFITITLPPRFYRKGVKRQYEIMDKIFKNICLNYVYKAYGAYELTKKGNIHCHVMAELRAEYYVLSNMEAVAKMMSSFLKAYSMCDCQVIKNIEHTYNYIYKEVEDSNTIMQKNACRSFERQPEDMFINPLSKQMDYGLDINEEIYE